MRTDYNRSIYNNKETANGHESVYRDTISPNAGKFT